MKKFIPAVIVFFLVLSVGFWIACHKPLWNDELYTLVSSIHHQSYKEMIVGHIPEGNNSPLFYIVQKAIIDLTHYQVSDAWIAGDWSKSDLFSQLLLRVIPVVAMSLSVALVFYFFSRQYSFLTGVLSVLIYASSYMLWVYWAEARPYALFVLLTTVQSLILIQRVVMRNEHKRWLLGLGAVQVLLALTSIFSVGQVVAAAFVLCWANKKDWLWYLGVTLLPLLIIFFYYAHAPHYPFYFDLTPEQLIRDNMSRERFYIVGIFMGIWLWFRLKKIGDLSRIMPYVQFFCFIMIMTVLFLAFFAITAKPKGEGFAVANRYFIYLMPIGVIVTTWMTLLLWRSLSAWRILQAGYACLIAGLLLPKFIKIVPRAIHSILGGS